MHFNTLPITVEEGLCDALVVPLHPLCSAKEPSRVFPQDMLPECVGIFFSVSARNIDVDYFRISRISVTGSDMYLQRHLRSDVNCRCGFGMVESDTELALSFGAVPDH
jgi:hypothetical protein